VVSLPLDHGSPEAKEAVPALTEALKDPDPEVREEAREALGRIGQAVDSED
jgi:HEAT repeat protein